MYHHYDEKFKFPIVKVDSTARPAQILLRNTAWLFAAQIVLKLLAFYSTIVVANHLDVGNFGLFNFAISFTTLFIPIFDFGMDAFLVREVAVGGEDSQRLLGSAVVSKLFLSIFGFAAIFLMSFFVEAAHSNEKIIILAAVALFLKNLSTSFVSLLPGQPSDGFGCEDFNCGEGCRSWIDSFSCLAIFRFRKNSLVLDRRRYVSTRVLDCCRLSSHSCIYCYFCAARA